MNSNLIRLLFVLFIFTFLLSFFTTFVTTKHNQAKINRIINALNHADLISPDSAPADPPKDEYDYICNHIILNFLEKDYLKILLAEKNTICIPWSFWHCSSQNDISLMVENLSAILDTGLGMYFFNQCHFIIYVFIGCEFMVGCAACTGNMNLLVSIIKGHISYHI